jgi:hypothetical protein
MTFDILEKKHIDKIQIIKMAYFKGFVGSIVVVMLGLAVSYMLNYYYPLNTTTIGLLQAFSVVPGSAALFGVQGWNIQTWSGTTPPEVLNQNLFRSLSTIGLFLAIVAFSLNPVSEAKI